MSRTGYIFDIKRFAIHDGPGIRTTIFFKGCPLRCWWCHNPESHKILPERFNDCGIKRSYNRLLPDSDNELGKKVDTDFLMFEVEKDRVFYEESGGGVTFSGGEPLMQPEFLTAALIEAKKRDINTVVDTSGFSKWELIENIINYTDQFLYDIKLIDSVLHEEYTGVSNKLIIENLINLDKIEAKYTLRIPIVPGVTDTKHNVQGLKKLASTLKNLNNINFLPYHRIGVGKYKKYKKTDKLPDTPVPLDSHLEELKNDFTKLIPYVKIGG